MTCKEKYAKDHPELSQLQIHDVITSCCPEEYGITYLDKTCLNSDCIGCWNTEIPVEVEKKTEETKEKESKKTMATTVKKTKAQLMEELDLAKEHAAALEKQLKNMERYKQYEECADEIKAMHTSFVNAGFTDVQAFDLIKTMTTCVFNNELAKVVRRR